MVIVDTADEIFLRLFLSNLDLLSISEPYNWPPSKNAIGRALNIPRLKLINHSQKRVFAIIANDWPKILDSYFGAIKSEKGTNCSASVGGGSIGTI